MTHDPDLSIALKMLPSTLFRDTVARLTGGQTVRRVARWLTTQDRGELQHLGFYDIRKQVAQVKGRIDRKEDVSDPPPEPQAGQAVPAYYEVLLLKLLEMARAGRATGRDILNFVLCTELELVRDLLQKGGSYAEASTVLQHVRGIAEQLRKAGAESSTACERFDELTLEGASGRVLQLYEEAKQMSVKDRMLAKHVIGLYRRLLKINAEIREQGGDPGPEFSFSTLRGDKTLGDGREKLEQNS